MPEGEARFGGGAQPPIGVSSSDRPCSPKMTAATAPGPPPGPCRRRNKRCSSSHAGVLYAAAVFHACLSQGGTTLAAAAPLGGSPAVAQLLAAVSTAAEEPPVGRSAGSEPDPRSNGPRVPAMQPAAAVTISGGNGQDFLRPSAAALFDT